MYPRRDHGRLELLLSRRFEAGSVAADGAVHYTAFAILTLRLPVMPIAVSAKTIQILTDTLLPWAF